MWSTPLCCVCPSVYVIDRTQGSCGVCDIPEVFRHGITYTTVSEGSMWLVPQLTAFHQSQAEKSFAENSC